jgi:hypothetical protein
MQNDLAKQVSVAFDEQVVPTFEDALVLSKKVKVRPTDSTKMERAGDTEWLPMAQIAKAADGIDATNDFKPITQLVVPATLGFHKRVTAGFDSKELRDALVTKSFGKAAAQTLASEVNLAVMDAVCGAATIIATKASAAADFEDAAQLDSIFNRNGIPQMGRHLGYATSVYNKLAKDLAGRGTLTDKAVTAYEKALIGKDVSSFEAHKLDYANISTVAAGSGITMDTRTSAANYHKPKATTSGASGRSNFDNRTQQITVSSTTNVAAGDAFTTALVYECHKITKRSTGNLKTFRVISVDSATVLTISPPMITAQGGTQPELQYQNCIVATETSNSALVWLNTVAKPINPFWIQDAVVLLPARIAVPEGVGLRVSRATTEQGIEIVMTESGEINTLSYEVRWDIFFGVCIVQPEMVGIQLFEQT